jgi:hypothetical protein
VTQVVERNQIILLTGTHLAIKMAIQTGWTDVTPAPSPSTMSVSFHKS